MPYENTPLTLALHVIIISVFHFIEYKKKRFPFTEPFFSKIIQNDNILHT